MGKPTSCFEAADKPIADAHDATALPHHNDGRSTCRRGTLLDAPPSHQRTIQSPPSRPHTYPGSRNSKPIIVKYHDTHHIFVGREEG